MVDYVIENKNSTLTKVTSRFFQYTLFPDYIRDSSLLGPWSGWGTSTKDVMNLQWDYNYYWPWSDNEWLVEEILAMMDEGNNDASMYH